MITIFNRKSVYIGFDMGKSYGIRQLLSANDIPYTINTRNQMGQWAGLGTHQSRMGTLGQSVDTMYEYEIFVHKNDFEEAVHLIQQIH